MSASSLTINHVRKSFGDKVILSDVNIQAEPGEFVVLVGPSGCGKSTLLRCIAGLETVDQGSITIDEDPITDKAPKDRDVAMVFQDYALYPHKTVFENIAFGLRIRRVPEAQIQKKVTAAAEKLGLTDRLNAKPSALSGGQRQRVAIGRAIVREPKVFLFDEPLSNLDAKLRGTMRVSLARLHRELKTTIVYVTHDQVEAMTLADRIVVLDQGTVQQVGSPLDLYYHPVNTFVAQFIGSPPMNLIPGRCQQSGSDVEFVSAKGLRFALPEPFAARMRDHIGIDVLWGLRAENLRPVSDATAGEVVAQFEASIEVTEPLGATTSVVCSLSGHDVHVTLAAPHRPAVGAAMTLGLVSKHLYIFDKETGHALGDD